MRPRILPADLEIELPKLVTEHSLQAFSCSLSYSFDTGLAPRAEDQNISLLLAVQLKSLALLPAQLNVDGTENLRSNLATNIPATVADDGGTALTYGTVIMCW